MKYRPEYTKIDRPKTANSFTHDATLQFKCNRWLHVIHPSVNTTRLHFYLAAAIHAISCGYTCFRTLLEYYTMPAKALDTHIGSNY